MTKDILDILNNIQELSNITIYQNYNNKYIIEYITVDQKKYLIEEKNNNEWLLTFNKIPLERINTKKIKKILKNANKILVLI